jgi:hypothetical protein
MDVVVTLGVVVAFKVMAVMVMVMAFMVRNLFDVGRHFDKGTQDVVDKLMGQATRCVRPARKQISIYVRYDRIYYIGITGAEPFSKAVRKLTEIS